MLKRAERLWLLSTFTLPILTAPAFSFAISSRIGAIILQGPHHSAQKSTSTGCALLVTSLSKFPSSIVTAAEFSMIFLRKICPELNEQSQHGNAEQSPAKLRWNRFNQPLRRRTGNWRWRGP